MKFEIVNSTVMSGSRTHQFCTAWRIFATTPDGERFWHDYQWLSRPRRRYTQPGYMPPPEQAIRLVERMQKANLSTLGTHWRRVLR